MLFVAALVSQAPSANAPAPGQSILHCYPFPTEIGVVARRDFADEHGFIIKEIYYTSTESKLPLTCAESTLRVHAIRIYKRDEMGRALTETDTTPSGAVVGVWRREYRGDEKRPARDVLSDPGGAARYEIRDEGKFSTHLYYDDRHRVIGVIGTVPSDVDIAIVWGPETDGWQCGIALAPQRRGERYPAVYLHLRNNSDKEAEAGFARYFETELRDSAGNVVPLTEKYLAESAGKTRRKGMFHGVEPGGAAFYEYEIESRYGRLPPGHYSLIVRHPHPTTDAMLASGVLEFDMPAGR